MWDDISWLLMWNTSFGAALLQRRVSCFLALVLLPVQRFTRPFSDDMWGSVGMR
jgi:hypothetical protein